jgi:hypothetical protein
VLFYVRAATFAAIADRAILGSVDTSRRLLIAAQLLLACAYTLPVFSPDLITNSDFLSFYTGCAIMRNGQGARIYDLDLQSTFQAQVLGPEGARFPFRLLPFINPPHAALVLMPLGYLSPKSAAAVLLVINCLVAAWMLHRLWQLATAWPRTARIFLLTTILATEVFWYSLATRTMTVLVFACLLEYYLALGARRHGTAAIWLIAATVKPQLILLPALIPLVQRRWRIAAIAASLGLLVALGVSLILGFHIWLDYFRLLREVSAHGEMYGASPMLMNNLRMILYRTTPSAAVGPLVYLALLGGAAGTCWLWRYARNFGLRFALTVLAGLFLAPHLNYQDTLVAILPAAICWDWAHRKSASLVRAFQVLIVAVTFVPPALIFTGYSRTLRWIWPLPVILFSLAVCVHALQREGHDS